jgi:hypothetical protein
MEQTDISMTVVPKLRLCAAIVGGGAMIALGGIAVYCTQSAEVTASGDAGAGAPTTTTPPSAPAVAKAVPSITGPAPLYAGEAPNSNPQAAIP